MRILILDNSMTIRKRMYENEAMGGTELNLLLLSEALSLLNHSVFLLCNTDSPDLNDEKFILDKNVNYKKYLDISDVVIISRFIDDSVINDIFRINRKIPVFLHTGDAYDQPNIFPLFDRRFKNFFEKFFRSIITVSSWQADTFSLYSGIPRDRFLVIPNCCFKYDWIYGYDIREDNSMIFASVPYKGLEFVYYIFNDIAKELRKDIRLYCFSSMNLYNRDDDETMKLIIGRMKSDNRVFYKEKVDVLTLLSFFRKSKIYIHPSTYHETFCISIVQAQACGCVPIAISSGAMSERIINGYNGFLVNCADIRNYKCYKLFKDKVIEILDSDIYKVSLNAQSNAKQFEYMKVASNFINILEKMI